ncbi:MAG: polymerase, beta domain protein region [Gemmatimonadetes bacterium]|nr:polymerase, beta domain protein region [Gemmatimonadota bacterium]
MTRDEAVRIISARLGELQRFHVESLSLFGSVARDEAAPGSDVDVLVQFRGPATFDRYMGLLEYLEERLGAEVDLVTTTGLRERARENVERELIRVA